MKLPLPFFKKDEPKEYFLALLLHDESIKAVIFEEEAGEMYVVNEHETTIPQPLEEASLDSLLQTADNAISTAESTLPKNIQTHRTIFGLKESWVEQTAIKKDRLVILKHLCTELDLQPLGFLVFSEAIAHLLQQEEGAPVSGVLVEIGTILVTVTLLRAGRIVEVKQSSMGDNTLPLTVDTLLQSFTNAEILPSRIILSDPQHQSHLLQAFLHHHWTKTLPFLHVPQVTTLKEGFDTRAILYGTASQMGFVMSDEPIRSVKHPPLSESNPLYNLSPVPQEEAQQEEKHLFDEKREDESFGFIMGKDVLEDGPTPIKTDTPYTTDQSFALIPEEVKEQEEGISSGTNGINGTFLIEGAEKVIRQLRHLHIKKPQFFARGNHTEHAPQPLQQTTKGRKYPFVYFLIPGLLLILLGIILLYIFGLSATATITLSPNVVNNTMNVTFSTTDPTDISGHIIGGSSVTVDESGSANTSSSGTKNIGDKAKGTVTIYNLSDSSQSYASGTIITAPNGLKFTLDNNVSVASGSSDPINPVAGKTDVTVTASDIGTDYNFPSGTKFTIGDNANIAAENSNAFSGGSKKTVTVVSPDDLTKLTNNLINSLSAKAHIDLSQKSDNSKGILSVFLKTDLTKKSYDNQVGTQANSITLNGTITFTGLAYPKSDLDSMAKSALQAKIAQNHFAGQGISEDIGNTVVKDNSVIAQVTFKASLLPVVDSSNIAKQVAGKSYSEAQQIFSSLPQFTSDQVTLSPNLFFLPEFLPRIPSHIHLVIKSNE